MDSTTDKISFKVISWDDWSNAITKRIIEELRYAVDLDVEDLIFAPKLDPENPKDFCKRFVFDELYEDRVFVRHNTNKDSYWFINGDSTCLLYKPKLQ